MRGISDWGPANQAPELYAKLPVRSDMVVSDTLPELLEVSAILTMERANPVTVHETESNWSSDRQVFCAMLLVGVVTLMMLIFEILDRLEFEPALLLLFSRERSQPNSSSWLPSPGLARWRSGK